MQAVDKKSNVNSKYYVPMLIAAYTLLLLSGNFVGDHTLRIFYFTYSIGTLIFQLSFCAIIGFMETIGFRKTSKIIWFTGSVNIIVALIVYYLLGFPIPECWVIQDLDQSESWRQVNVIAMLSVGYIVSTLAMVNVASLLRVLLGRDWLLLRVMLILAVGLFVDLLVITPILFFLAPDRYMALWKLLSMISVKISLSLWAIPVSYLWVFLLRRRLVIFNSR